MAIEISKAIDRQYLITQLSGFEKYALYDEKIDPTDGSKYLRHRYRKLDDTYEWQENFEYKVGVVAIHDNKLWKAIVDTNKAAFDPTDWEMVGAASIFNVVSALPAESTLTEDQAFVLKADEVDGTGVVVHKKGMWVFDATVGAYYQFDEHEVTDLDLVEMFDKTAVSTFKGSEKVVDSAYLYTQIGSAVTPLKEKIDELFDIAKDAEYIILEDEVELKAYNLATLKDHTMNIFLVKEDHDHRVDPLDPTSEPTATLYGCVAVVPASDRKLDYIGQLSMSGEATKKLIQDMIDREVKIIIPAHYENCNPTDAGALEIVADGTTPLDPDTQIEESNVNPVGDGTNTTPGNYVVLVPERISGEYKFMEKKDYDTETLQKVSHEEVVYTDPDGVEPDVTVDYLTYFGTRVMPHEFENSAIRFNDPTDYDPIVEGPI